MPENKKLVRIVRQTQEFVVFGTACSSGESYWDVDFRETCRVPLRKPEETTLEPLREMTALETALLENAVQKRDD